MSCKIKFTGYKTNQRDYYDSYADFDLVIALVRSFHDVDMQQWQGFVDAANELTGTNDWVVDSNNTIKYYSDSIPENCVSHTCETYPLLYYINNSEELGYYPTKELAVLEDYKRIGGWDIYWSNPRNASCVLYSGNDKYECTYTVDYRGVSQERSTFVHAKENPNYDPNAEREVSYLPLENVAQKIISNAQLSVEAISIHAENYINAVANSIFEATPDKQFIKIDDLYEQLEQNKIIRI